MPVQLSTGGRIWARISVAFILGFLSGFVAEYLLKPPGAVGAAAGIGGATAIAASVAAAVLPEFFARDREHRQFLREHSDLLRTQVYVPLISSRTTIAGDVLNPSEASMDLERSGGPDWGYPAGGGPFPVTEFSNWALGRQHIESDPAVASLFRSVWQRLEKRVTRKTEMDSLYVERISQGVSAIYGTGFVVASNFTTPEPPRWLNAAVLVNWVRRSTIGYDLNEQVAGSQHRIMGGGMILLTSDRPFVAPASDLSKVLAASTAASDLQESWREWNHENELDQSALSEFVRAIKLAGERIQATHHIPGHCEVCST